MHWIIQSNQTVWLKPSFDLNTKLRKIANNDLEKEEFKLINITVFAKTMENIIKERDTKNIWQMKKEKSV